MIYLVKIEYLEGGLRYEYASYTNDIPAEVAKWMRKQAERIRKEPYQAPRFEGEYPLDGLEDDSDTAGG